MALRVIDVLDNTVRNHPDRPALRHKRNGQWVATSWRDYREQVRRTARGFMALGLEPGGCVTIIGYNRPEWFCADMGAIAAGGVPAGIYTTSSAEQCRWIASHCEAQIAVVENAEQLAKFLAVRTQLPSLKAIVMMDQDSHHPQGVYSWADLMKMGEGVSEADLDARLAAQKPEDLCTLIYTSGTTGDPKAVMLSHTNITWTAEAAGKMVGILPTDDTISYLPLSHIAEQITTMHGTMMYGGCTWFAESMEKLGENLKDVRPHYFLGVPRVWEKIQEKMQAAGAAAPELRKKIVRWAKGIGLAGGYADQAGGTRPTLWPLADKLIFTKVKKALGFDRARILVTSAAPISRDTLEFFLSLGLPVCEVYGMSECTGPATVSVPTKYRTGKAGIPIPGTQIRIADDGEICMKGPHVFMGYYKNPAATAETLDSEGWLHSGDIGTIDAQGFLQITDRKKELIITAGGENIAPQMVEGVIKSIPVVSQAVVVGDREKYLSVLVTLDPAKVPDIAKEIGLGDSDMASLVNDPKFRSYLEREIERVNSKLARVQTVKKFAIIPDEFTIDGGELTPTMKLRRRVVHAKYADVIKGFYAAG